MKLQFAFNPRKKSGKKKVAKGKKKSKTKRVKAKLKKAVQMAKRRKTPKKVLRSLRKKRDKAKRVMKSKRATSKQRKSARKAHTKLYRSIKKKTGRNPIHAYASKKVNGKSKRIGHTSTLEPHEIEKRIKTDVSIASFRKKAEAMRKAKRYDEAKAFADRANRLQKMKLENFEKDRKAYQKDVDQYKADGATIKYTKSVEGAVAKKKKASKKKASKKKASKKKTAKKASRKSTKRTARKGSRKGRRKGGKRRMLTHTHAKSTRHIRRGSRSKISARKRKGSYKVKAYFGKGKKRVKMTGSLRQSKGFLKGIFKINPFRSNPVAYKNRSGLEKVAGHDIMELGTIAAAAAAAPMVTKGFVKYVMPYVAAYIPASIVPHVVNMLPAIGGVLLNVANDKYKQDARIQSFADSLIAVGVITSVYAAATKMTGMSGINFTPSMGIMPQMNGINFTPNMGVMPQLNGITTHGDFGAAGDYGGKVGWQQSRADFGSDWAQDSESDMYSEDGDLHSSSMN